MLAIAKLIDKIVFVYEKMRAMQTTIARAPRIALFAVYTLASVAVFIAALLSPRFASMAAAPLRDWIMPEPEPIVLSLLYSTEKAAWLDETITEFENTQKTASGRPIQIEFSKAGSREIYLDVLNGAQPDMISPASSLQISLLEDLSEAKFGDAIVDSVGSGDCRPVLKTPLVLVAWSERAEVLWGDEINGDLWKALHAAVIDPEGWASYGQAEWGYVKFGQTNPLKSNSGFMTIVLMSADYFGQSSLNAGDILSDQTYQEWFLEFQNTISEFGDSTGTYMREIVAYGPSKYDIVAVYEATAIEQAENAEGRYGELRVYYPPATVMSDHPFCILNGAWVTPEKREAARLFVEYLSSTPAQEAALMNYGFRPVDPSITLDQNGSPFQTYRSHGIRIDIPAEITVPDGNTLNTLLDFWNRNVGQ